MSIVNKTFTYKSIPVMKTLYMGLIRPRVEYCVQAWSPHQRKDIEKIEKMQRRATKMIPELRQLSYEDRLVRLQLTTLEERRLRGDMIQTFKLVNGYENVDPNRYFKLNPSVYGTRRRSKSLNVTMTRLDCRKYFFSNRVVTPWNSLSEDCVTASSVNAFKNSYDKHVEQKKVKELINPYSFQ